MPVSQFFRANVGIAVLDGAGGVLALERYEFPGSWQSTRVVKQLG